jgi:hypothetical protein
MIIPDGITPEIGWRTWVVRRDGMLTSLNDTPWMPKEALEAVCAHAPKRRWVAQPYGRLRPMGRELREFRLGDQSVAMAYVDSYDTGSLKELMEPVPTVRLPKGWGYELEEIPKEVPEENCHCGIYALRSKSRIIISPYLNQADVVGAVNLWGKVIPGQDGFRAQFAYPLALWTDKELLDYGVPVAPMKDLDRNIPVRLLKGKKR